MQRDEASAFLDDKIKIDKENETLIDKFKCTYKIRLINNPNGYLYLTSYKVIFYNDKNQISVPLSDIVSVSKVNEYIEVKTKKKSFLFFNFEDDSKCIAAITKNSVDSHNCRNEVNFTIENNKAVLYITAPVIFIQRPLKISKTSVTIG